MALTMLSSAVYAFEVRYVRLTRLPWQYKYKWLYQIPA